MFLKIRYAGPRHGSDNRDQMFVATTDLSVTEADLLSHDSLPKLGDEKLINGVRMVCWQREVKFISDGKLQLYFSRLIGLQKLFGFSSSSSWKVDPWWELLCRYRRIEPEACFPCP